MCRRFFNFLSMPAIASAILTLSFLGCGAEDDFATGPQDSSPSAAAARYKKMRWRNLPNPAYQPKPREVRTPDNASITRSVNREVDEWWATVSKKFAPVIKKNLADEITKALKDQSAVKLKEIMYINVNLDTPPAFLAWSKEKATLRLPREGTYSLKGKIKVKGGLFGQTYKISFGIRKVSLEQTIELDHSDPTLIKFKDFSKPRVKAVIDVSSSNTLAKIVLKVVRPILNGVLTNFVGKYEKKLGKDFAVLKTHSRRVVGEKGRLLPHPKKGIRVKDLIGNVEKSISKYHLPYGTILRAKTDRYDTTSWLEHFSKTSKIKGKVVGHDGKMDTSIFSGIYLAAQVYRYVATKDSAALANVRKVISGFGKLFDVNGDGLMARIAVPKNSPMGKKILRDGLRFRERKIDGKTWISFQGKKGRGISRDQNLGALFGLGIAWEFLGKSHPAIAKECKRLLGMQFRYMLKNNWTLEGDDNEVPTFWSPFSMQKYAYLAVNNHITGGKYRAELDKIRKNSPMLWFNAFFNGQDTVKKYYKFNLSFMATYLVLHFERDGLIRSNAFKAHKLDARKLANHMNPYFDLFRIDFGSAHKADLSGNIRGALGSFVKRCHRAAPCRPFTPPPVDNITVKIPLFADKPETIPEVPLDPFYRHHAGLFQWERSPWRIKEFPGHDSDRKAELPGLAISFPYWFGQSLGGVFRSGD